MSSLFFILTAGVLAASGGATAAAANNSTNSTTPLSFPNSTNTTSPPPSKPEPLLPPAEWKAPVAAAWASVSSWAGGKVPCDDQPVLLPNFNSTGGAGTGGADGGGDAVVIDYSVDIDGKGTFESAMSIYFDIDDDATYGISIEADTAPGAEQGLLLGPLAAGAVSSCLQDILDERRNGEVCPSATTTSNTCPSGRCLGSRCCAKIMSDASCDACGADGKCMRCKTGFNLASNGLRCTKATTTGRPASNGGGVGNWNNNVGGGDSNEGQISAAGFEDGTNGNGQGGNGGTGNGGGLGAGAAAGIAVGAVLVLLIALVIVRRRRAAGALGRSLSSNSVKDSWNPFEILRDRVKVNIGNKDHSLGQGNFGQVHRGSLQPELDKGKTMDRETMIEKSLFVAIKSLPEGADEEARLDFEAEIQLMKTFSNDPHPNVLNLVGHCLQQGYPLLAILPLCNMGDLRAFLLLRNPMTRERMSEAERSKAGPQVGMGLGPDAMVGFSQQIAAGMSKLEELKIVHRDLAARNVLLHMGPDGVICKIADFGLSRETSMYLASESKVIPWKWMAPEVFLSDRKIFSTASDVWAFGVVLWEIAMLGVTPYPGKDNNQVSREVMEGKTLDLPARAPDAMKQIMAKCFAFGPHMRPPFKDIAQKLSWELKQMTSQEGSAYVYNEDPYLMPNKESSSGLPGFATISAQGNYETYEAITSDGGLDELPPNPLGMLSGGVAINFDTDGYLAPAQQPLAGHANGNMASAAAASSSSRRDSMMSSTSAGGEYLQIDSAEEPAGSSSSNGGHGGWSMTPNAQQQQQGAYGAKIEYQHQQQQQMRDGIGGSSSSSGSGGAHHYSTATNAMPMAGAHHYSTATNAMPMAAPPEGYGQKIELQQQTGQQQPALNVYQDMYEDPPDSRLMVGNNNAYLQPVMGTGGGGGGVVVTDNIYEEAEESFDGFDMPPTGNTRV